VKENKKTNWSAVIWHILLFVFTASGSITLSAGMVYTNVAVAIAGTVLSMIAIWLLIEGIMAAKED